MGIRKNNEAQATVELAIAFPVAIIIAVICINALMFFGECSAFDRVARQSVRAIASSPASGQDSYTIKNFIDSNLKAEFNKEYLDVSVKLEGESFGKENYMATLEFSPNLFGKGFTKEVFGVPLFKLSHTTNLVVDPYKASVFL